MRKPSAVAEEIDHLHNTYGIKTYKIIDEMFVLNERHVLGLCDELIARDYGLNIWAYARVDTVKPHMLSKLRKAGVRWLALGIESGSEHVRDGAEKSFNQSEIIDIVRQIQQADISVIGNFIFGLPDDDLETMNQTLALAAELNCEFANFYSAMAYPGSPLYAMAIKTGGAARDLSGFSQHSYDCLPLPTESSGPKFSSSATSVRSLFHQQHIATWSPRNWLNLAYIDQMTRHISCAKIVEEMDGGATPACRRPDRRYRVCGRVRRAVSSRV